VPAEFRSSQQSCDGSRPTKAGRAGGTFRLWAPAARHVELLLDRLHPMDALPDGWHEVAIAGARAGTLYKFRIDGELDVLDPASAFQPGDRVSSQADACSASFAARGRRRAAFPERPDGRVFGSSYWRRSADVIADPD
jgi:1,4-alpha-glucan branching enzyme